MQQTAARRLLRFLRPPGWAGFVISVASVAYYQETRIEEQRQLVFVQEIQVQQLKERNENLFQYIHSLKNSLPPTTNAENCQKTQHMQFKLLPYD